MRTCFSSTCAALLQNTHASKATLGSRMYARVFRCGALTGESGRPSRSRSHARRLAVFCSKPAHHFSMTTKLHHIQTSACFLCKICCCVSHARLSLCKPKGFSGPNMFAHMTAAIAGQLCSSTCVPRKCPLELNMCKPPCKIMAQFDSLTSSCNVARRCCRACCAQAGRCDCQLITKLAAKLASRFLLCCSQVKVVHHALTYSLWL
jgi:hypothetical protein